MRQFRLSIVVGVALVALCGIALFSALVDYTTHPEVANAHVPPVVGAPARAHGAATAGPAGAGPVVTPPEPVVTPPAASGQVPEPAAPAPIVTAPVDTQPGTPAAQPVPPAAEQGLQGNEDGDRAPQRSEGHGHHGQPHGGD